MSKIRIRIKVIGDETYLSDLMDVETKEIEDMIGEVIGDRGAFMAIKVEGNGIFFPKEIINKSIITVLEDI